MIGGPTHRGIHLSIKVVVACVMVVFFEVKVFFTRHGVRMLSRHGPLLAGMMCCSGCLWEISTILVYDVAYQGQRYRSRRLLLCDLTCDASLMIFNHPGRLHVFFRLLTLSPALFAYVFTHRFQRAAGFPTSGYPELLWAVQHETCYLPIRDVIQMLPPGIAHVECAAFLLIVIQEDSLLTILVLEVTAIHAGEGLLVNLRRYAASFSMMIGDPKQWLVTHHILQCLASPYERAEQKHPPSYQREK